MTAQLTCCSECGGRLSSDAMGCPHCQAELMACRACGRRIGRDRTVCPGCGFDFLLVECPVCHAGVRQPDAVEGGLHPECYRRVLPSLEVPCPVCGERLRYTSYRDNRVVCTACGHPFWGPGFAECGACGVPVSLADPTQRERRELSPGVDNSYHQAHYHQPCMPSDRELFGVPPAKDRIPTRGTLSRCQTCRAFHHKIIRGRTRRGSSYDLCYSTHGSEPKTELCVVCGRSAGEAGAHPNCLAAVYPSLDVRCSCWGTLHFEFYDAEWQPHPVCPRCGRSPDPWPFARCKWCGHPVLRSRAVILPYEIGGRDWLSGAFHRRCLWTARLVLAWSKRGTGHSLGW